MLSRRSKVNSNTATYEMAKVLDQEPLTVVSRQNMSQYSDTSIQMFEGGTDFE